MAKTKTVITEVTKHVAAQGITQEQVNAVLAALNSVQGGEPLNTVKQCVHTGKIYVRVDCDGVHRWRVIDPKDGTANVFDERPTFVGNCLYQPPPTEVPVPEATSDPVEPVEVKKPAKKA